MWFEDVKIVGIERAQCLVHESNPDNCELTLILNQEPDEEWLTVLSELADRQDEFVQAHHRQLMVFGSRHRVEELLRLAHSLVDQANGVFREKFQLPLQAQRELDDILSAIESQG